MLMKKSVIIGTVVLTAVLCGAPFSVQRTAADNLSLGIETASAAELAVPARRSVSRHARYAGYYRERSYDLLCGGPYVGGGWNGGTYWGGPWMDLRCYGGSVEPVVQAEPVVRVKG